MTTSLHESLPEPASGVHARPRIVAIGEVLWDLLPQGRVLGGAPANVAFHARALGADARLVSRIGRDELGDEIAERLRNAGLPLEEMQRDGLAPTGTVGVEIDHTGQPRYTIHSDAAWDHLASTPTAAEAVRNADAICFGSLAQRSPKARETVQTLVADSPADALRVFDLNLRLPFFSRSVVEESLALANVLKLNDEELPVLAEWFALSGPEQDQVAQLASLFDLRLVALTRGGRGSFLWTSAASEEHVGLRVAVRDTVGAGDAFTATMTLAFLLGWALPEISQRANQVAAFVCSHDGATPPLPPSLRLLP